jgi:hypothetical protein
MRWIAGGEPICRVPRRVCFGMTEKIRRKGKEKKRKGKKKKENRK